MYTDRRILSRGRAFRVITSLLPDAPAIVLVHGIGASHRYLSRLHAELARTNTVHSVDLPGFGGLPKPPEAPDVPVMASALARVLDRLGVRDAVLVGHSMGAEWTVELAVQRPDLARAVVAIGPVADRDHRSLVAQGIALARDILGEPPHVNAVVFADYLRCGPVYFLREAVPMIRYPIEDRITELVAPMLVLRGGNDPIASSAWCALLRDRATHGSLVEVPGHRHVVQHTAPLVVATAIRELMASIPAASVPRGVKHEPQEHEPQEDDVSRCERASAFPDAQARLREGAAPPADRAGEPAAVGHGVRRPGAGHLRGP